MWKLPKMGVTLSRKPVFFKVVLSSVHRKCHSWWWLTECVIGKKTVLFPTITTSPCSLTGGLWLTFVAPAVWKSTPGPPFCLPLLRRGLLHLTAVCWSAQVGTPTGIKSSRQGFWILWIRGIFSKVPLATSRQESLTSVNHYVNPCCPLPPRNMNEMLTFLYSSAWKSPTFIWQPGQPPLHA